MVSLEWGTKRLCQSCATKFYDFGRATVLCPKCGVEFDPEALLKSRRRPGAKSARVEEQPVKKVLPQPKAKAASEEGEDLAVAESEEEEEAVIEDVSELGEDDGDVSEVAGSGKKDEDT